MSKSQIIKQIKSIFNTHLGGPPAALGKLVPPKVSEGKLYEAFVLARIVENLSLQNGYELTLVGGDKIYFKSAPGPINTAYPRIQLKENGVCVAELWTDIEFLSLSCCIRNSNPITNGDYHELDIIVVDADTSGRPRPDTIWLGVECKNTGYHKALLKEILGIRRELSLLQEPLPTRFDPWPRTMVPASPPSCLVVYSTDPSVNQYSAPGGVFGIDFFHQPMSN
jgi:hypothetical protein